MATAFTLIFRRMARNFSKRLQERNLEEDAEQILNFTGGTLQRNELKLHMNSALRDFIVRFAGTVMGREKELLGTLYESLGFSIQDASLIHHGSNLEMAEALARCRTLEFDLPDAEWKFLLSHPKLTYRWAALEYLIAVKKKFSLPWLFVFFSENRNRKKGVMQHLLSCVAKSAPESIPTILDFSDDELISEQCLRVLAVYPQPGLEDRIIRSMRSSSSDESFIAAVKALGAAPSLTSLNLFRLASTHSHWVVRLEIARALVHFDEPEALGLLSQLATDSSYHVRLRTIETLLDLGVVATEVSQEILISTDHPSHALYLYAKEMKESRNERDL